MGNTTETTNQIKVKWRCPSNIAIVKYWGKKGIQIPCNSSLSLTLSNSYTEVEATLHEKTTLESVELNYYFEGELNEKFGKRVADYLADNIEVFPYLRMGAVTIHSSNSFPHSAGIASSASAFGAIALAMLDIAYQLEEKELDDDFYRRASEMARLGSGSACRSIFPSYALWGQNDAIEDASDDYAVEVTQIHPIFKDMRDAILIIEDEPKKVSSTIGHSLMNDHPFAAQRFTQANKRTAELVDILAEGDVDSFIHICESEALTLHAMMMTSTDYYLLVKPGTITAIEKIMQFRLENMVPVCFTLDAGPNVHILYPDKYQEAVEDFINDELKDIYKKVIFDHEGQGPQKLSI
ncbi:MAG: diphosphomevalonate decarboxylase [Crocinitomicaceae bacterium]|nr:diphosphomevalonate decarboxylase [Crocinitomicaceae bacterium]